jgi:hypothetical protein
MQHKASFLLCNKNKTPSDTKKRAKCELNKKASTRLLKIFLKIRSGRCMMGYGFHLAGEGPLTSSSSSSVHVVSKKRESNTLPVNQSTALRTRMIRTVSIVGVLLAVCIESNDAFAPGSNVFSGTMNQGRSAAFLHLPGRRAVTAGSLILRATSDDDATDPGMADAFRKLEDLDSFIDDAEEATHVPASQPNPTFSSPDDPLPSVEPATPEKEVQMYKDMVKDLELHNEDDLYSNVLADMGGSAPKESAGPTTSPINIDVVMSDTTITETEEFMNKALKEALAEVKGNNPSAAESILDDKEIMKEIEAIFERGNDKLMESLEVIRQEQVCTVCTPLTIALLV